MANTASARKRNRQSKRRTERNQARKSRMRTFIKKVEVAITGGDKEAAGAAFRAAQPEMQRAAGKGVVHRNTIPVNSYVRIKSPDNGSTTASLCWLIETVRTDNRSYARSHEYNPINCGAATVATYTAAGNDIRFITDLEIFFGYLVAAQTIRS